MAQLGLSDRVGILPEPEADPVLAAQGVGESEVLGAGQRRVQRLRMAVVPLAMQDRVEALVAVVKADRGEAPQRPAAGIVVLHAAEQVEEQILPGVLDIEPGNVVLAADPAGSVVGTLEQGVKVGGVDLGRHGGQPRCWWADLAEAMSR